MFQQKQSYKNINVLKLSNFIKKRNLGKIQFSGQNFIIIKVEINWFLFWKYKSLLNFISKKNVKNSLLILELLCIAYQFVKWLKSGEQRRPLESCCIHHLGCLPNVGVGWARRSYNWSGGGWFLQEIILIILKNLIQNYFTTLSWYFSDFIMSIVARVSNVVNGPFVCENLICFKASL